MKKIVFLLLIIFGLSFNSFSQGIQLAYDGEVLSMDQELWVSGELNSLLLFHELEISNVSGAAMDVRVKKTELDLVAGTINYFCYAGLCYGPDTYVSPNVITLQNGESTEDFSGDYEPGPNAGTSSIAYTFYNDANPNDSARVIVKFMAFPLGTEDQALENLEISSIYPNPANSFAQFDYQLNEPDAEVRIVVYNLVGAIVDEEILVNSFGQIRFDTRNFEEGIYFYKVMVNSHVLTTEKLIIKH